MKKTLFVDMYVWADGKAVRKWLDANSVTIEWWEPQMQADQIKLHGCRNVPDVLPAGISVRDES